MGKINSREFCDQLYEIAKRRYKELKPRVLGMGEVKTDTENVIFHTFNLNKEIIEETLKARPSLKREWVNA